jgi:hypothetical protein
MPWTLVIPDVHGLYIPILDHTIPGSIRLVESGMSQWITSQVTGMMGIYII